MIDKSVIIPEGYKLTAGPGVTLDLKNNACFVSYSTLNWTGSSEEPIIVESSDGTGQGLVVLNAPDTSKLERVLFRNLSNPTQGVWQLTGAVTFYESNVNMKRCTVTQNRCEDGLNIVQPVCFCKAGYPGQLR